VAEKLNLSSIKPAAARKSRKRIGRGPGSGKGRYSGRGIKGQKARSGSNKMRPGFEGGQMPIYMRLGKQRGSTSKDAMPVGPHRTRTQAVNVRDLERFDGDVTPDTLKEAGLIRSTRIDVKILGHGELTKKLTVSAHLFSASAREKIEKAGGTITWIRGEPAAKRPVRKRQRRGPVEGVRRNREVPPGNEEVQVEETAEEPVAAEQTAEVEEPPTPEPPPEGDDET
jgi:large subunit ribosomal protein L15